MAAKRFGYVRVSTREQNPERQIHILRDEEGIDERDIYVEKESGRNFERPVYRSLVDNILREGMILEEAARLGTGTLMHLSTLTEEDTFSSQRAEMILVSENSQTALVSQILETMAAKGYQGLDVDFEYIPGMLREEYAAFIYRLHTALAPRGLPVIVALAPKTRRDQPGLLYEGHDYARLGQAADYVLVMTYEWHILAHILIDW